MTPSYGRNSCRLFGETRLLCHKADTQKSVVIYLRMMMIDDRPNATVL
jgi:hypothetical protein